MTGPKHIREAERLLGMAHHFTYGDGGDAAVGAALAAEAQGYALLALVAQLAPAAPPAVPAAQAVTVYRAAYEHSPFPLGLYANPEAARAHCEAVVSDEYPAGTALFFEWSVDEDEPESVCELDVRIGDETTSTGYTVTAVVAEAAYDPEADA
ncbi:hypothetical protein [Streptomyces sp. NPDC090093]|uniref:hypothetical protein n=1 Tax=Streptomyces sp. NPDC090093 TaxID=3365945 RepID=UPI00382F6BC2